MIYNGYFYQCLMTPGPFYWIPYAYYVITNASLILICARRYSRYQGVEKKRIALILLGLSFPILATLGHTMHLFGNIELLGFGLFGAMLCFMLTVTHLGYFDSVQAAANNVLEYGNEGLIVVSLEGEILYSNRLGSTIFPGARVHAMVSGDAELSRVFSQGGGEISAGESTYSVRVEEIKEFDKVQARMLWMIDMTQYYAYTDELKRMSELAERANSYKSAFLTNMSHEIRTPMNAILGMNEMILRESEQDSVQEYAHNIDSAGRTLLSIINDILDISKIESGKLEIISARYEISAVLNDVINMTYQQAHNKGLWYKVEVDPDIPYLLIGDEARIRQVLLNVVNNAVKYTQKGGLTLKASYQNTDDAHAIKLVFTVTDTGAGIREEDLPRLFKNFERLDLAANHAIEGTGLGLSITKQLVEKMGGYVLVESIFGEGSIFTIVLDARVESFQPIGEFTQAMHSMQTSVKREAHVETFTAPKAKMLVIDDNEMNHMVIKGLLRLTQLHIDTALNGVEGIKLVEKKRYDLLMIDHMMPQMDGMETLKILKERKLIEGIPVIALTANALTGARDTYMKAGFTDYIPKPIDPDKLERTIAAYLPAELVIYTVKPSEQLNLSDVHIPGVDVPSGIYYAGGNLESYEELLTVYARVTGATLEKMEAYALAGDLANYQILVHSLKSTSAGIGASALAAHAAQHEQKSAEGENEAVRSDLGSLVRETRALLAAIKLYLSKRKTPSEVLKKTDRETLGAMLEEAYAKLMAFDSEGEDLLKEILKNEMNEEERTAVETALRFAQDYEYYQSADAIKELL